MRQALNLNLIYVNIIKYILLNYKHYMHKLACKIEAKGFHKKVCNSVM